MNRCGTRQVAGLCLVALAIVGCGESYQIKTVHVHGTVTYNGEPVEDAILFCIRENPASNTEAPNANGQTDASGEFDLTTYRTGDGAVPGNYLVGITKSIPDPKTADAPVPGTMNVLPEKYQNPTSSSLKMTVEAGKNNDFKFELTD